MKRFDHPLWGVLEHDEQHKSYYTLYIKIFFLSIPIIPIKNFLIYAIMHFLLLLVFQICWKKAVVTCVFCKINRCL